MGKIVTKFAPKDMTINTSYGNIPYEIWCGYEADRIGKGNKKFEYYVTHKRKTYTVKDNAGNLLTKYGKTLCAVSKRKVKS